LASLFVKVQLPDLSQASSVQVLLSLQTTGVPAVQWPPAQRSPVVQASPSLQGAVLGALVHAPVCGLQLSVVQTFESSHVFDVPEQTPPAHWSAKVHALPSSQLRVLFTWPQPVAGTQTAVVQGFASSGQAVTEPKHRPPVQVSPVVQASPSEQGPMPVQAAAMVSATAAEGMPFATTTMRYAPFASPAGRATCVLTTALPVATPIVEWLKVRA
jgi:hypothetical protein